MTTHRRYFFVHPQEWTGGRHDKVRQILESSVNEYWWFSDPHVEGAPFNRMSFSFTVSARDQWFAHRRAMHLAERVCRAIKLKPVPEPAWEPLEPHMNRGRFWRKENNPASP